MSSYIGNVSRFADVKKKTREKSRPKAAEAPAPEPETKPAGRGRGRGGSEGGRGGRGRGSERGRGGTRGGRGGASASFSGTRSNATPAAASSATPSAGWDSSTPSGGWDSTPAAPAPGGWDSPPGNADVGADHANAGSGWEGNADADGAPVPDGHKSSLIPEGTTKSWASMLAQPKRAPVVAKAAPTAQAAPEAEQSHHVEPNSAWDASDQDSVVQNRATELVAEESAVSQGQAPAITVDEQPIGTNASYSAPDPSVIPPKAPLTEDNVENLPDVSVPAPTETVLSTRDPSSVIGSATPSYSASQQPPIARPPAGGYATSAWRATGVPGRSASYQRKMMEQREAVVMPGNHAVDRAAVQFGSMGLNGDEGGKPLDVDEEREDAETRTQPPQQSPSQPRASLPPANRQHTVGADVTPHDNFPTPKQAPGFPAAVQPPAQSSAASQTPPSGPAAQSFGAPGLQGASQGYNQYGRYGAASMGQEPIAPSQKSYDAFGQQLSYPQGQNEQQSTYASHSQAAAPPSQSAQSFTGGGSQAPADPGTSYTSENPRSAYQNYYSSAFGPQSSSNLQENVPPQRSASGMGTAEPGFGSTNLGQSQSRFTESQASGHNTPNPPIGSQSQQSQQHLHQQPPGQTAHGGGFPYQNPYYGGYNYGAYMNQVSRERTLRTTYAQAKHRSKYPNQYNYGHQGYGGPFGGKGGMYNQPHHGYGMSPQTSYDQSSSPANASAFGPSSLHNRDSALSGFNNEYSRSGSTQPSQPHQSSLSTAFGSMSDTFGRASSGFGSHNQGYGPSTSGTSEDSLKAFQDTKTGPSPAVGQPGRPGSGFNAPSHPGNQSGYGPPQQGYGGGYPNHLNQLHNNHSSQYGGLGGLGGQHGGAQSHHGGAYGGYGGGFGNAYSNYGGGRGGWGGSYGH